MTTEELKKHKIALEKALNDLDKALSDAGFKDPKDPSCAHIQTHMTTIRGTIQGRLRDAAYNALGE